MTELLRVVMAELLRIALRAIGVVLPAAAILGMVDLLWGDVDVYLQVFLGAAFISLLTATALAASDARWPRSAGCWSAGPPLP